MTQALLVHAVLSIEPPPHDDDILPLPGVEGLLLILLQTLSLMLFAGCSVGTDLAVAWNESDNTAIFAFRGSSSSAV